MPDVIVEFDTRPVIIEVGAGPETLRAILLAVETTRARAARYGITDPLLAASFTETSIEADFAEGTYRSGFTSTTVIFALPSWAFARAGAGVGLTAGGGVIPFATGVPRITDAGLLVETASTNQLTYSEQLNDASWAKSGTAAVSANAAIAPDGTTTADRLQAGAASGSMQKTSATALTSGLPVTVSFWAKGTGTLGLRSGVSGMNTTRVLTAVWQRFTWTFNAGGTAEIVQIGNSGLVAGASATIDAHIWGVQLENGNHASSYIATTTATATRAKDDASYAVTASQGGFFIDADLPPETATTAHVLASWTNGTDRHLTLFRSPANQLTLGLVKPDGNISLTISGYGGARRVKAFVGWGDGQLVWTVDGVAQASSPLALPLTLTTVRPGSDRLASDKLNGTVRRLLTTTRLPTAAQRIAMTA